MKQTLESINKLRDKRVDKWVRVSQQMANAINLLHINPKQIVGANCYVGKGYRYFYNGKYNSLKKEFINR